MKPSLSLFVATAAASMLFVSPALAASPPASGSEIFAGAAAEIGAVPAGAASANKRLDLLLALRVDDAGLDRYATAVGSPGSPLFRHYLEPAAIAQRFGASAADQKAVIANLARRGIASRSGLGALWIEATVTVAQAQQLFSTRIAAYQAQGGERFVAPATSPSLPADLRGTVTAVIGLDSAPVLHTADSLSPRPKANESQGPLSPLTRRGSLTFNAAERRHYSSARGNLGTQQGCDDAIKAGKQIGTKYYVPSFSPNQYLTAYGFSTLHRQGITGLGQRVAVVEIDGFNRSDLLAAASCFGYTAPATPITRVGISRNLAPGGETTLDLQVLAAAAPGLSEIQVYEGGPALHAVVKLFAAALSRPAATRASVISSSIGGCESHWSVAMRSTMERTLRTAVLMGVTVLSASGDSGSSDCFINGHPNTTGVLLSVDYPGSSPWVTSVGGTNLNLSATNKIAEEVVWNEQRHLGAGGGGFSRMFARPSWQKGPGVTTSRNRRIVPDLSMLADNMPGYAIYMPKGPSSGGWSAHGGTSASAPLLAAGVILANQQAQSAGQAQLGWINASVYRLARKGSKAPIFRDILSLDNDLGEWIGPESGGDNDLLGCCSATPNFDAASGWGSVNIPALSSALRGLQ